MKFQLRLDTDLVLDIVSEIDKAESDGCEDIQITILGEVQKNNIVKIENINLYGSCITEYSKAIL